VRLATVTGTAKSELDVDPEQLETPEGAPPLRIRLDDREAETRVLMDLSRGEAVGRYSRVSESVVAEMKLPNGVFRRVMNETSTSELGGSGWAAVRRGDAATRGATDSEVVRARRHGPCPTSKTNPHGRLRFAPLSVAPGDGGVGV